MNEIRVSILILFVLTLSSCKQSSKKEQSGHTPTENDQEANDTLYQSERLIVHKLSDHVFVHTSYLQTEDYGKVGCNGMLVVNENKAVLFDTPTDDTTSAELIDFITNKLTSEIIGVIPTHFHNDCLGGIRKFEESDIPTYLSNQTLNLLKESGDSLPEKCDTFNTQLVLSLGNEKVYVDYLGEGHTRDNVVGYFPKDEAVFGGCLIKRLGASKGYLGDANTDQWSETVRTVKAKYANASMVIPGHGKWGGTELFDYTIELFEPADTSEQAEHNKPAN
ncbi:MAG: subclass B1 metallo-beta-lactamase [Bacteroidia bacterium]|nr:subclass B1 metallo-beta-lactamase [Bacteroidia bacterium]